jgi:hypothetical protein
VGDEPEIVQATVLGKLVSVFEWRTRPADATQPTTPKAPDGWEIDGAENSLYLVRQTYDLFWVEN